MDGIAWTLSGKYTERMCSGYLYAYVEFGPSGMVSHSRHTYSSEQDQVWDSTQSSTQSNATTRMEARDDTEGEGYTARNAGLEELTPQEEHHCFDDEWSRS